MVIRVRDFIEDFADIQEAHRTFLSECAAMDDFLGRVAYRLTTGLQQRIDDLNRGMQMGHAPAAIDPAFQIDAYVFVGDVGTLSTRQKGERVAVLIDLDLILRLVLFVWLVGWDDDKDRVWPVTELLSPTTAIITWSS